MKYEKTETGVHPLAEEVPCEQGPKKLFWVVQVLDGNGKKPAPVKQGKIQLKLDAWPEGKAPFAFLVDLENQKKDDATTDDNGYVTLIFKQEKDEELTAKELGLTITHTAKPKDKEQTWVGLVLVGKDQATEKKDTFVKHQSTVKLLWDRRDWIYNECLANAPLYSKPDAEKFFTLWEAEGSSIEITACEGVEDSHPALWNLFIVDANKPHVRFPWNAADSGPGSSLSPMTASMLGQDAVTKFLPPGNGKLRYLRRWSSASRSCIALVPKSDPDPLDACWQQDDQYAEGKKDHHRFVAGVGPFFGDYCNGAKRKYLSDPESMLYSIKTGVNKVGNADEKGHGKNLLEANSTMAIIRSNVVLKVGAKDQTLRMQPEFLTVTAKCKLGEEDQEVRDGFQVRDISCMRSGEFYLPAHAIPYSEDAFHAEYGSPEKAAKDFEFWKTNFAVPLGRAKAKMFLEYGLIHSSANAQNFILAFDSANKLRALILRDIGDTYWHDDYVEKILGKRHPAYTLGVQEERKRKDRHLLHATSSSAYPPPHLVRIAAFSVVTHDFGKMLVTNRKWSWVEVLQFTQAILDGFYQYMFEAKVLLGGDAKPRKADELKDVCTKDRIKELGKTLCYPYPQLKASGFKKEEDRQGEIVKFLNLESNELVAWGDIGGGPDPDWFLGLQRGIRRESAAWLEGEVDKQEFTRLLVNAEEIALCAYIEQKLFVEPVEKQQSVKALPLLLQK